MRDTIVTAARTLAVFVAALAGGTAAAQAPRPVFEQLPAPAARPSAAPAERGRVPAEVGRLEVYDGPRRTVYYNPPDLSPGERAALHDLAQSENETAYADELLELKRAYVQSELTLEPYRRWIQQQLYGFSTESTYSGYVAGGYYPYAWGGYGYGGWGGGYFGGATTTTSKSLANGVGYEGPVKEAMARQIAADAAPPFATAASRGEAAAWSRVAASERLARAFGVNRSEVVPAASTTPPHVVLTLKNGEKVEGALQGEDADSIRVDTGTGTTVTVRKSDVAQRVESPKK
jgi:hypothetical protein